MACRGRHRPIRSWRIALLLAVAVEAHAAPNHRLASWTTDNGLPQNTINDILQTRDGYLWLATFGGIVRFDGVRFTIFDSSVDGVGSQRVTALYEDRTGALWTGSEDGMLIRYQQGRFHTYTSEDGLPFDQAVRIEEDGDGVLWITWLGAVTRFDGRRFVNILPGELPKRVAPSPGHYLDAWWSHDADGIHVLKGGRVSSYKLPNEWLTSGVTGVSRDRTGNLLVRTRADGTVKIVGEHAERLTSKEGLPHHADVFHFATDRTGGMWLRDSQGGLLRVAGGSSQRIDVPGARALFQDRDGSIWIGTVADGLYRVDDTLVTLHAESDGLSLRNVYPILQDRAGAIWIGHATLNKFERGRWASFGAAGGLSPYDNTVTCLYEDANRRLWVGTQHGLTYFDRGRLRRYEDPSRFLAGAVWAMLDDSAGARWFATDNGLVKAEHGRFTRYTTADGLTHDRVTSLFEAAGVLWIGTFRGLTRLENGAFTRYTEREGFIGNQVRTIYQDRDGVLWVGTYDGGLYRLAGERLTRFTRKVGLHDNGVFQILEDEAGYLWMGSNRGISRIKRAELNDVADGRRRFLSPLVLGAKDGLTPIEVNGGRQPPGLKTGDGKLWFPTLGGIAVLDPADFLASATAPRAVIEDVSVAGAPTAIAGELTISADTPYFEIRYTAPTFIRPEQVRFRYKLAGLDDEWVEAGDRRAATFQRVPPGRYQFVVVSSLSGGAWSDVPASVSLIVLPPFWRTGWFATMMVVAATMFVAVGYHRRVGGLRRLHRLQEAFSRKLIESQERERRRISSEMHDSLGQHIAILKKRVRTGGEHGIDETRIRAALDEIGALADRIDEEMKDIAQGLRPYHLDTIGLSNSIEAMVRQVGSACDIAFTADVAPVDALFPDESRIHVYRIVQECVSNVIRHSYASHAQVSVRVRSRSVEIMVEDDGCGMTRGERDAVSPGQVSFGLMGLHERARMLGGRVAIRSSAGNGTTVVVTLPVDEASHV